MNFGQQRAPFGGTPSAFGANFGTTPTTSSAFGATTFGQAGFGNQQQATSFGAVRPFGSGAAAGGGLFGTTATQQQPLGGLFGQQQQTGGAFGQATGGFGTASASPFGQTQQQTAGLFGSGGTTFGSQPAQQNRPFGFGASTSNATSGGGLFGTGQQTTGGLFGASSGLTSAFGTQAGPVIGTTVKYAPVPGTDSISKNGVTSNINTRIEVITAMKEYENKSLEELRVEDYLANRKGPGQSVMMGAFGQQTQQQTGGLFGTSASGGGLFSMNKPAENKSLFGATSTGFGTPSGSGLFGGATSTFGQTSTAGATGFSFGQTAPKPTGFGFGNPVTSSTGLFGQTQPQNTGFGGFSLGQTSQQNTGLFGGQAKPFFGTATTQSTGLFGKPIGTAATPFGTAVPSTGLFGTQSATLTPFSNTATTSATGLFGTSTAQNKPSSLFGSSFGAPATSGFGTGLFGSTLAKPTGLNFGTTGFGSNASTGLNFGAGNTAGMGASGGLFNFAGTNIAGGGLNFGSGGFNFGQPSNSGLNFQSTQSSMASPFSGLEPNVANLVRVMTENPFGETLFKKNVPLNIATTSVSPPSVLPTGPSAALSLYGYSHIVSPSVISTTSLKPRPKVVSRGTTAGSNRHWLLGGSEEVADNTSASDDGRVKSFPSVKKLNLKVFKDVSQDNRINLPSSDSNVTRAPLPNPMHSNSPAGPSNDNGKRQSLNLIRDEISDEFIRGQNLNMISPSQPKDLNDTIAELNAFRALPSRKDRAIPPVEAVGSTVSGAVGNEENDLDDKENPSSISILEGSGTNVHDASILAGESDHPAGVKLTRAGYYTIPSMDDLATMIRDGHCLVENFTIGRGGYGNVCFPGVTDVTGFNLDEVVVIVRKLIDVYPAGTMKPPLGEGLNKPALVTLDCVWPIDKTTRDVIKTPKRLIKMDWLQYLERQSLKMDASFVEYRPESGSWVFKVKHFSKYGLLEEDDDSVMVSMATPPQYLVPSTGESHCPLPPTAGLPISFPSVSTEVNTPISVGPSSPLAQPHALLMAPSNVSGLHLFVSRSSQFEQDSMHISGGLALDISSSLDSSSNDDCAAMMVSPSTERLQLASRAAPRTVQQIKSQLFDKADEDEEMDVHRPASNRPGALMSSSITNNANVVPAKKMNLGLSFSDNISGSSSPAVSENFCKNSHQVQVAPMEIVSKIAKPDQLTMKPRDTRTNYPKLKSTGFGSDSRYGQEPPRHQAVIVPLASSLLHDRERSLGDAAALMGRSFRVGWGPGWKLVHAGLPQKEEGTKNAASPQFSMTSLLFGGPLNSAIWTQSMMTFRGDGPKYTLTFEKLNLVNQKSVNEFMQSTLEKVLEFSASFTVNDSLVEGPSKCPGWHPSSGTALLQGLAEVAEDRMPDDGVSNIVDVFALCVSLWGDMEGLSEDSCDPYVEARMRVEAVSQWVECVSATLVEAEVEAALSGNGEERYLKAVFAHLSGRQVYEACILAQKNGDHHLAMLIAQSCFGDEVPRQILQHQLNNWAEAGIDALMHPDRLKLYCLLAGQPIHRSSTAVMNVFHKLRWRSAFALFLWYISPATATVNEVLEAYEEAAGMTGVEESFCEKPYPPYHQALHLPHEKKGSYDVCYHLLKLFTDPKHRLDALLNISTITPDPLNITVSWLLLCILESLGYTHLSEALVNDLHLGMAAQLEAAAMWHWAIFVLLHLKNENLRCKEVQEVLFRNVEVAADLEQEAEYKNRENFVMNRLGVPDHWIFTAKATKARTLHLLDEEAWYLLKAGENNKAHMIIVETIAPRSIVNEDHQYLRNFLEQLSHRRVNCSITDWASGGKVYLNYLDVCAFVENLKQHGEVDTGKMEGIRSRLIDLAGRLNSLKCPTPLHRLCLSEMSRMVVGILGAVSTEGQLETTQLLSRLVSELPFTPEYALGELNHMVNQYLILVANQN